MTIDLKPLANAPRLLLTVPLRPVQGSRFQPTGFPDLGASVYQAGDTPVVLVESAQSMANRMEAVCWDEGADDVFEPLRGLSYIRVEEDGKYLTSSMTEAHRVNSVYIERADDGGFHKQLEEEIGYREDRPFDRGRFARTLAKYDIGSLIHGVFLESVGGRLRFARALSSFVEAEQAQVAASGGVKNDHVQPGTTSGSGRTAAQGFGNVPFHREEYTAEQINAYFNLDLDQIHGYGLDEDVQHLLVLLSLYKIRALLESKLRFRTACDLMMAGDSPITADAPDGFELPSLDELEAELPEVISKCSDRMAGVTTVAYSK